MKKRILYISQLYPYSANSGGKIKTLNSLLTLAKQYEIYAVFISEEMPKQSDLAYLVKRGMKVKVFYSPTILASVKDDVAGLFSKFIRGIPHYVFQYTYYPAIPFIGKEIHRFKPDIIHVDHLNMSQYLPENKHCVWILEHHNAEAYLYYTRFVHTWKLTRKAYLFMEMLLTYVYERRALRKFDHIFAISKPDESRIRNMYGVTNVSTQPMIYSVNNVRKVRHTNPTISFVGTMGWPPNEDAIDWFLEDILPKIKLKIPNVEFHTAGKPGLRYEPKGEKQIYFHGLVRNINPLLSKTDVFVLPFRMGGGLRLKALTALSAGLSVVTTPLGVEGLEVQNGRDCIFAYNAQYFADEVVKLLLNKELRRALEKNAIRYVASHHNEGKNDLFLKEYNRVTQEHL